MTPTLWLLGDPPGTTFQELSQALIEAGAQTVLLGGDRARDWLRAVATDDPVSVAPNLLVLDAGLAMADDHELLRALGEHLPWRFLPRVVVASRHNPEACAAAYRLGAANWVVIPPEAPDQAQACSVFADYWVRCSGLPRLQEFTLD